MFALENVRLTARQATTDIGVIDDPGHAEPWIIAPWIIAMAATPGYLKTLDYSARWAIEPMFSDFKSRGFGGADTQIRHPDRLARLLLVMALALCTAVSTGRWDAATNPTPAEKRCEAPARESRSLQNLLFHQRVAPHRPPHPQRPPAAAALVSSNGWMLSEAGEIRPGAEWLEALAFPLLPPVVSECVLEVGRRIATP